MRYGALYQEGRTLLQQALIEEADLDARILLEHVCHTNRNDLLVHADKEVTEVWEHTYRSLIARRAVHIPLQQLTGIQEFMGLEFLVNEHVLIPRQDTEILVEEAMRRMQDGMHILDMCTGSGCVLLSLLHYSNETAGLGVDLSLQALEVARQNAKQLAIKADFIRSNLYEQVNKNDKFDMIVSNPPYIPCAVIETLMPEVKDHEPRMALDGREDGLYYYREIINTSRYYLHGGASLLLEIGWEQGKQVTEYMEQAGYTQIEIVQDLAGLNRVVVGTYMEEIKDV